MGSPGAASKGWARSSSVEPVAKGEREEFAQLGKKCKSCSPQRAPCREQSCREAEEADDELLLLQGTPVFLHSVILPFPSPSPRLLAPWTGKNWPPAPLDFLDVVLICFSRTHHCGGILLKAVCVCVLLVLLYTGTFRHYSPYTLGLLDCYLSPQA